MAQFTCGDCGKGSGAHTLQCPRFGRSAEAMKQRLRRDERSKKGRKEVTK